MLYEYIVPRYGAACANIFLPFPDIVVDAGIRQEG